MAEVVNEMPKSNRTSAFAKYADGQIWKLTKGKDYSSDTGFQNGFRAYANRNGMKATCRIREGFLYVQAVKKS